MGMLPMVKCSQCSKKFKTRRQGVLHLLDCHIHVFDELLEVRGPYQSTGQNMVEYWHSKALRAQERADRFAESKCPSLDNYDGETN